MKYFVVILLIASAQFASVNAEVIEGLTPECFMDATVLSMGKDQPSSVAIRGHSSVQYYTQSETGWILSDSLDIPEGIIPGQVNFIQSIDTDQDSIDELCLAIGDSLHIYRQAKTLEKLHVLKLEYCVHDLCVLYVDSSKTIIAYLGFDHNEGRRAPLHRPMYLCVAEIHGGETRYIYDDSKQFGYCEYESGGIGLFANVQAGKDLQVIVEEQMGGSPGDVRYAEHIWSGDSLQHVRDYSICNMQFVPGQFSCTPEKRPTWLGTGACVDNVTYYVCKELMFERRDSLEIVKFCKDSLVVVEMIEGAGMAYNNCYSWLNLYGYGYGVFIAGYYKGTYRFYPVDL